MKILHPNKENDIALIKLRHLLKNKVYDVIDKNKCYKLNYYLECFENHRILNGLIINNKSAHKNLPILLGTVE